MDAYNREQRGKREILAHLLENYNGGRKKSFFCPAVNLLELSELRETVERLPAADVFRNIAGRRNTELKLRKKTGRRENDSGNLQR